ncbi:dephospho-CoA kinase [Ceratobasidium sp. AG-Ba]|nr:dephospho-CoA kinase [Ceratobasidium sp. AG-Ba]
MADADAVTIALHHMETVAIHGFASKSMFVAGICILLYDHILTFPDEVEYIWKQKWSVVSTMFVLNRYITPLVLAVDLYDKGGLPNYIPKSFCVGWYYGESVWNLLCFGFVHAIVALRVRAIWGRPRWLSITLSVLFATYFLTTTVVVYALQIKVVHTVEYNPLYRICLATISPHLWTCWLPALIFETFVFVLTVIKAREHSKANFDTPILRILVRDGVVYFVIICACSVFNMLIWIVAPPSLVALSKYFVLAVVPTMGARLVLNLRGSRREDLMPTTGRSTTDDSRGFEMQAKGGRPGKPLPGERFVFASFRAGETFDDEEQNPSLYERTRLSQINSSRMGTKGDGN